MPRGSKVLGTRVVVCPHCGNPSTVDIRGRAVWDNCGEDGAPQGPPVEWTFTQCERCRQPGVQIREDFGRGFGDDEPTFVYPSPHRLSPTVPEDLRREWDEAKTCFDAKAYAACVVMVRRTLEGTCAEQGVKKRRLAVSLDELKARGLIDSTLVEWAHALRFAGNQGAHYTRKPVSRENAEDALAFAEALLDHIYVLRRRFNEFRQRVTGS